MPYPMNSYVPFALAIFDIKVLWKKKTAITIK